MKNRIFTGITCLTSSWPGAMNILARYCQTRRHKAKTNSNHFYQLGDDFPLTGVRDSAVSSSLCPVSHFQPRCSPLL